MNMKKIMMLLLVVFFISIVSANAGTTSSGGILDLNVDTAAGDPVFSVGLSPKVVMYHVTNGTGPTDTQWYAISAGHPGGNRCYATAQDVNNVYYKSYTTTTGLSTYMESIPENPLSPEVWAATWSL